MKVRNFRNPQGSYPVDYKMILTNESDDFRLNSNDPLKSANS